MHVDDEADYQDPDLLGYQDRLAGLRDEQGVVRLRFGDRSGLVVLRHADVTTAFREDGRFSKSLATRPATFPFMGPNIQGYDGHEHTVIPRYIEPLLRPCADELAAEIAPRGAADLMATFAQRYPMRVIAQLLSIPRDDEDRMGSWAKAMLNMTADPDGARRANAEFTDYVAPLVDARRSRPGADLLSAIVTEEVDGQRLGDDEVFGFLRLLFPAGVDTTWLTLGILMGAVLQQPVSVRDRLLASSDEREWAIEETLRWESTTGSEPRVTLEDVVLSGVEIPTGKLLRLAVPVANRDPHVFEDPDQWSLDRRPTSHLAFGLGRHFCLGAFLARAELNVALEVLLRDLPNLRLDEDLRVYGVVLRGPRTLHVAWDAP